MSPYDIYVEAYERSERLFLVFTSGAGMELVCGEEVEEFSQSQFICTFLCHLDFLY